MKKYISLVAREVPREEGSKYRPWCARFLGQPEPEWDHKDEARARRARQETRREEENFKYGEAG